MAYIHTTRYESYLQLFQTPFQDSITAETSAKKQPFHHSKVRQCRGSCVISNTEHMHFERVTFAAASEESRCGEKEEKEKDGMDEKTVRFKPTDT